MKKIGYVLLLLTLNMAHASLFVSIQSSRLDEVMEQNRKLVENEINQLNSQSNEQYHFEPDMHTAHITLAFIDADPTITAGNASQKYPQLDKKLSAIAQKIAPIDITNSVRESTIAYWPSGRRDMTLGGSTKKNYLITVLELGANAQLTALAQEIRAELETSYGIKPTFQTFKAHLTLGRIYEPNDNPSVKTLANSLAKKPLMAQNTPVYVNEMILNGSGDTVKFPFSGMKEIVVVSATGTQYPVAENLVKESGFFKKQSVADRRVITNLPDDQVKIVVEILSNSHNIPEAIKTNKLHFLPFIDSDQEYFLSFLTRFELSRDVIKRVKNFLEKYYVIVWADRTEYPWLKESNIKASFFQELQEKLQKIGSKIGSFIPNKSIPYVEIDMMNYLSSTDDLDTIEAYLNSLKANNFFKLIQTIEKFKLDISKKILLLLCQYEFELEAGSEKMQVTIPEDVKGIMAGFKTNFAQLFEWGILPKESSDSTLLDVSRCCLSDITKIAEYFKNLERITKFNVSYNRLNTFPAQLFTDLGSLQELNLSYNRIRFLGISFYNPASTAHSPQPLPLINLYLYFNHIVELEAGWARDLSNLRRLDLSYNPLGNAFVSGWAWGLSQLEELLLSNDNISLLHSGWAKGLTNLKKLDITGNPIKVEGLERGWGQGLKNLRTIIIDKDSALKKRIDWELNGMWSYLGRPNVKIIERERP